MSKSSKVKNEIGLYDKALSKGASEVFRIRTIQDKKNKIRIRYGSEVLYAIVFDIDHPLKTECIEELDNIDKQYHYIEPGYLDDN